MDSAPPQHGAAGVKGVLLPVIIVLVIGTIFVSVYLAAFHAPRPHRLPVAAVGSSQQIHNAGSGLDAGLSGGFDVKRYASEGEARHALEHREVYAAYIGSGDTPKLLYAGANGPSVTGTVTEAFGAVAKAEGHSLAQRDVAPTSAGDTRGMSVFYAAFGLVLAGYLFGMMTYQMAPRLQFRRRMVSLASFGVFGGLIIALIAGDTGFGALPGSFLTVAGLTAMMAAAAGGATMVFMRLFGMAGLSLASVVLLTLGNSTSGGFLPAQYLPGWLRPLSEILPVGVGVRAVQGASYFHNDGLVRGLVVLAAWIIGCAAILYAKDVGIGRRRRDRLASA
ncbi:ABC transporter permease [Streptomyces sp. H27-D2]|uniref:ABC transporter permease n=1 Tax=Streptomyces sp. H27-D2 TaxID=3046304 RepID=UPI002DB6F1AF|nr:ABC transporter permease [Streptomyces sp. H27-D2]